MGNRHAYAASATSTVAGTTEVAIISTEPLGETADNKSFLIAGNLAFTGNAAASTVTIKVRQGVGIAGTVVYTSPALSVAAAAVKTQHFMCTDTAPGADTYTVTATFSAAPGAAGAVTGTMTVLSLA